ncbi:MAG TPA: hypothetical protein VK622_05775 [Puia sp.]|nr:hypothetical protein [Puia sp.]HTE27526.1 hypothetical protein [Flavitalea sp.]
MDEFFCGSSDGYPITQFTPKSHPWSSDKLIGHININNITLSTETISQFQNVFWDYLCSEYDADNFCLFLDTYNGYLSSDFKAFEYVWRRDEYNHYLGFRHIYSTFYRLPYHEIDAKLKQRHVDFNPILPMLSDEFKICLMLAYDEIATTKSYAADYSFYESFGPKELLKWIKLVTRDEAYHFNNCMELIRKNHFHRIAEIPDLVDQFVNWDLDRNEYVGTFILDHNNYGIDFLQSCANIMKRYFVR